MLMLKLTAPSSLSQCEVGILFSSLLFFCLAASLMLIRIESVNFVSGLLL